MSIIRGYHEAGSEGCKVIFLCSSETAVDAAENVVKECGTCALFCAASDFLVVKYGNDRDAAVTLTV